MYLASTPENIRSDACTTGHEIVLRVPTYNVLLFVVLRVPTYNVHTFAVLRVPAYNVLPKL